MRVIQLLCFLLSCLFFLTSCDNDSLRESIEVNDCFADRPELEIAEDLEQINQTIEKEKEIEPIFDYIVVAGCYNYQLGNYAVADQRLNQAFNQSEDKEAKNVAASVLGLIYIKHSQKHKIKPYIASAAQHYLGRWMLVLYYTKYYQETGNKGDLSSAIKALGNKHEEDGVTSATNRLLTHMQHINTLEESCISNPDSKDCSKIEEEKIMLFDTTFGTLYRLLREQRSPIEEPSESVDSA